MFCRSCKCTEGELVKILTANPTGSHSFNVDTLYYSGISSLEELDEYVVLESHLYRKIFGKTKASASDSRKRLSVVRISYNGKSIHRAYLSAPASGFQQQYIALTPNSIYELSDGKHIPLLSKVTLAKGCRWIFYWNHPNAAVRMAFRIGIIGILFTIVLSFKDEMMCLLSIC